MIDSSSSQKILHDMSQQFPIHQWYRFFNRFFMHGKNNFSGWLPGEQEEPGFTIGAMTALLLELNHLDEPLTKEVIERIHKTVITGVLNTNYSPWDIQHNKVTYRQPGEYVGFGLIPGSNLSPQGLDELKEECPHPHFGYELQKSQIGQSDRHFYKLACLSDESEAMVSYCLEVYHEQLQAVLASEPEDDEILKTLCRLVTDLERLHPYGDGNCRTFGIIVLNRELVRMGFNPTLMDDPNQFDGYSQKELLDKIKEGQQRYQELLEDHKLSHTPYRSATLILKSTGQPIDRKSMSDYDLTDLSDFEFVESLEFEEGKPFQGNEQESFEYMFARMITESAIQNAHAKEPSAITEQLMSRLKDMDEEFKAIQPDAIEKNLEHFYHGDMFEVLSSLSFDVRLALFKGALNFGASSGVDYLGQVLDRCEESLTDYVVTIKNSQSNYALTLLGDCLQKGRYQLVEKMLYKLPSEQLELAISEDLITLMENKKWNDVSRYLNFVCQSNIYQQNPELKMMLLACSKSYDFYMNNPESSPIDSMLKLFHIKSEPLPILEKLLSKMVRALCTTSMPISEIKQDIQALPKDIKKTFSDFLKTSHKKKPSQI